MSRIALTHVQQVIATLTATDDEDATRCLMFIAGLAFLEISRSVGGQPSELLDRDELWYEVSRTVHTFMLDGRKTLQLSERRHGVLSSSAKTGRKL
jgi:hypothetical protein